MAGLAGRAGGQAGGQASIFIVDGYCLVGFAVVVVFVVVKESSSKISQSHVN